jgi:hypothetical protein
VIKYEKEKEDKSSKLERNKLNIYSPPIDMIE